MSVKKFFDATKKLPFDNRVELGHRLWDEFMDGFQDWKAPPIPRGKFPWKTLKAEVDAKLSRADRRAEDALKNPGRGTPIEEVFAKIEKRFAERRK
jgi:hypothetical protein